MFLINKYNVSPEILARWALREATAHNGHSQNVPSPKALTQGLFLIVLSSASDICHSRTPLPWFSVTLSPTDYVGWESEGKLF